MGTPVAVFQGYDAAMGVGRNTALEGETQSVGGTSFVKADICTSSTELMDSLQLDQSLTVGYAGLFNVSQKMHLVQSLSLTTFSTSIVVFARHTQGEEVVTRVRLRDGVTAPTQDEELRDFVDAYGDCYLSGCTIGGEYYAVYTYYSTSKEQQFELQAEMEAAGIFKGVAVDVSLQTKISHLNRSQKRRVSFQQRMSGIANPTFPNSEGIADFALNFPSMELTAPRIIQWTTSGYERVPGIGRRFNPVARNRELLAGRDASIALSKLRDLREDIKALQDLYTFYGGYADDTKLNKAQAEAEEDDRRVRDLVAAYREDPTQPLQGPLDLKSLANGSPSLEYVVQVSGKLGDGDTAFDDVDLSTCIDQRRKITSIQLHGFTNLLTCIVVTYADDKGNPVTVTHGDPNRGSPTHVLVVRPGRFITTVSGRYGRNPPWPLVSDVLLGLHIGLDNGEYISHGDFADPNFSWTSQPSGTFLLGFRGFKSGWIINFLQLVCASFRPSKWSV